MSVAFTFEVRWLIKQIVGYFFQGVGLGRGGGGGGVLGVVLEHVVLCRYHNMVQILISLLIFHKEVWRLGEREGEGCVVRTIHTCFMVPHFRFSISVYQAWNQPHYGNLTRMDSA